MDVPQFFIHSYTERHLGSFHISAIINKAAINILCAVFCVDVDFSAHLGTYRGVQLLNHIITVCLAM